MGMPYDDKYRPVYEKFYKMRKNFSDTQSVALAVACVLAEFNMTRHLYVKVLLYEEMIQYIKEETSDLFTKLGLKSANFVKHAIQALEVGH